MFDKIYEKLRWGRDHGSKMCRFGSADEEGNLLKHIDYVCFGRLFGDAIEGKSKYLYVVHNGEGKPEHKDLGHYARGKFVRGPVSDRWLKFVLDPVISPWRSMLHHVVEADFELTTETGIIIKDLGNLKANVLYNFLIGMRWGHEHCEKSQLWCDLQDQAGLTPGVAYLVAFGFKEADAKPVILQPAGFRRDPADRRRNLKDENGDPIWFPAEYAPADAARPRFQNLRFVVGGAHEPLPTINGYVRRVLSGELNPEYIGKSNAYGYNGGNNAWDIFRTPEDERKYGYEALHGSTLDQVVEYINKHR